ncbi:hypothetical protein K449DRAFT_439251 [Hypoxylon sp. EC38]|nr:hypothetical protein K449DRAFT_439251 [Hypoxylon sp. EC38]
MRFLISTVYPVSGPRNTLQGFFISQDDLAALQIALDRYCFQHVPLPSDSAPVDGVKISVAEIAQVGIDQNRSGHTPPFSAYQLPIEISITLVCRSKYFTQTLFQATQDAENRVVFQLHDFVDPQLVHDVSAFLLCQYLHNHNNAEPIKIISVVVPALEHRNRGTPLLITDMTLPNAGKITRTKEHPLRQVYLCMMVL